MTPEGIKDIEAALQAADPGEWRASPEGLRRYAGPFQRPEQSYAFAAKARSWVPMLLKAYQDAKVESERLRMLIALLRNELSSARTDASAAAENRAAERTGPAWEVGQLARLLTLWAAAPTAERDESHAGRYVEGLLKRWAGGESIAEDIRLSMGTAEKNASERKAYVEARDAEIEALRGRLSGYLVRLDAGEVPPAMAREWMRLTKADKAKALKGHGS